MRESPRIRRLRTDLKSLEKLKSESTILDFTALGNPPEVYRIVYHGKGLVCSNANSKVVTRERHEVEIKLGASYPRVMPEMAWKTPIFHPNISSGGVICLGGYGTYWVPSLNLDELCEMLWEMIRYENYDPKSPYNRDAALWVENQTEYRLPVDTRPIRDRLAGLAPAERRAEPANDEEIIEAEILFIDDDNIIDAEVVESDDPDILIIE